MCTLNCSTSHPSLMPSDYESAHPNRPLCWRRNSNVSDHSHRMPAPYTITPARREYLPGFIRLPHRGDGVITSHHHRLMPLRLPRNATTQPDLLCCARTWGTVASHRMSPGTLYITPPQERDLLGLLRSSPMRMDVIHCRLTSLMPLRLPKRTTKRLRHLCWRSQQEPYAITPAGANRTIIYTNHRTDGLTAAYIR